LSNYITEEHTKSIRWLKWQGYNFSKPMLVKNVKVLYFYKRLHNVVKKGTQPILEEIGPLWTTELI
jgi:c-di-GMP-related signal transduction protein